MSPRAGRDRPKITAASLAARLTMLVRVAALDEADAQGGRNESRCGDTRNENHVTYGERLTRWNERERKCCSG